MELNYKLLLIALLLIVPVTAGLEESKTQSITKLYVRVLLEEKSFPIEQEWTISGKEPVIVVDLENPGHRITSKKVKVTAKEDGIYVYDGQQVVLEQASIVQVMPRDGYLHFNNTWYQGAFSISKQDEKALLINSIDLEDYIFAVVKAEGWPKWPIEMNKVMAIACRSYVIAKVLEAQHQGRSYHIKNTNIHQKYDGYHERMDIKKAIDETRDIFLAYDGQPITAMFDICCGGVVPAKKKGVNFNHAPYLARTYACTYCKNYKVYTWSAAYSLSELESIFKTYVPSLRKLREVKVTKKDSAGIVQEICLKAASGYHYINGKKVYSLLKKIKSLCFSLERKRGRSIVIKGRGYGHHMGLCQWGARHMVDKGWNYERILKFFYPGTDFMRLTLLKEEDNAQL